MNCKPGDLAMVIKTMRGSQTGIVVRCLRPFTGVFRDGTPASKAQYQWWEIDKELSYPSGLASLCADRCLMPIKPLEDEPEELLTVCGCIKGNDNG